MIVLVQPGAPIAVRGSPGYEPAGLAALGKAGESGDFVHVHAGVGNARAAQHVLKRGRERLMVHHALGDHRHEYYEAGRMMYVHEPSRLRQSATLAAFVGGTAPRA